MRLNAEVNSGEHCYSLPVLALRPCRLEGVLGTDRAAQAGGRAWWHAPAA